MKTLSRIGCRLLDELEEIRKRKLAEIKSRTGKTEGAGQDGGMIEVTDANFDSVIRAKMFAVVDCWATWCYPCRIIAPVMEELAKEYGSVATFAKLDVDGNHSVTERYNIQRIPTILIIKDGIEVERVIGALPKAEIESVLKKHLKSLVGKV